jgi:NAD(P)-dependent dehydrogenase (short-subunit alcohol dehydrogenase family)
MTRDLEGKVAIVTGAAGGLGKALAQELAARGCYVSLADVQGDLLAQTAAELESGGARLDATTVDVRDAAQVQSLVDRASRDFGRIDYLYNNAGINLCAELRDTTLQDWNDLIDVNFRGVVHGVHAAYPIMREQGFGHVVNVASAAGLIPAAAEGAYGATKHAVVGLSSVLRIEGAAYGVRASVVCPGLIDTPLLESTKYVEFSPDAIVRISPEKAMDARKAARLVLRGVDRNRFFIVVSATAHAFWRIHRFAPAASLRLGQHAIRRLRGMKGGRR